MDVGVYAFGAVGLVEARNAVGGALLAGEGGGVWVVQHGAFAEAQSVEKVKVSRTQLAGVVVQADFAVRCAL